MTIKTIIPKILFVFCFFTVFPNFAQLEQKIDLAKNEGSVIEQTIVADTEFRIIITNRLPNANYTIVVEKKVSEVAAFTFPEKMEKDTLALLAICDFSDIIKALDSLTDEKELSKKAEDIRSEIKKADCAKEQKNIANKLLFNAINFHESKHIVNFGEQIEITVSRKAEDSDVTKVWKHIYKTQPRGKWVTTYGFSFITDAFSKKKTYFSDQEDTVFTITKNYREKKLLYVPTVFFTWMPTKKLNKDWSKSITGGLGFDLESPVVFLGGSVVYNQNIHLTVGLSAHKQDFLRGEYNVGDKLPSTLSEDQLHDKRYVVNPFVSLAFRFGSPIFKSASGASAAD